MRASVCMRVSVSAGEYEWANTALVNEWGCSLTAARVVVFAEGPLASSWVSSCNLSFMCVCVCGVWYVSRFVHKCSIQKRRVVIVGVVVI